MFDKTEVKEILISKDSNLVRLKDIALKMKKIVYGDEIFVRGIIEFSNYCRRDCLYCGIRKSRNIERYRLSKEEIIECSRNIYNKGIKTIVLQSGEDLYYSKELLVDIISNIKKELDCAITLCIGERDSDDYKAFYDAGADRFLIKHETSNERIYEILHPGDTLKNRLKIYEALIKIGYKAGLGNIIGLPFTSLEDYINDIFLMKELDCDMAGIGPFIPSEGTPLSDAPSPDLDIVFKILTIGRIILKDVNIPATTALFTLGGIEALSQGIDCGCNVIMPNFTPEEFRKKY
ncbi:MAG: [FeFe] hydrogenase H-cluster radical SAM maturase HydE, partial [Proteobacteria bacterium]|nr:[FeFe] hydrogenase H-cluster radical SAM maturase HydE [Pseudomonadota bacterium]